MEQDSLQKDDINYNVVVYHFHFRHFEIDLKRSGNI